VHSWEINALASKLNLAGILGVLASKLLPQAFSKSEVDQVSYLISSLCRLKEEFGVKPDLKVINDLVKQCLEKALSIEQVAQVDSLIYLACKLKETFRVQKDSEVNDLVKRFSKQALSKEGADRALFLKGADTLNKTFRSRGRILPASNWTKPVILSH
jgi:hypothetical protein